MSWTAKQPTTRREFLRQSAAVAFAAALSAKAEAASEDTPGEWRNRQSGMSYRRLGRTNFMISEVVCGGNTISPANFKHVEAAIDRGLNYLDTAPQYGKGQSELGYAKVIAGSSKREKIFLTSKASFWDSNRNKIFQDIFDGLPESERKKVLSEVQEDIEKSGVLEDNYVADYFQGQREEYRKAALSNAMERRYGGKIERRRNYHDLLIESVETSLRKLGAGYLDILMCPHGACSYAEVTQFPEIFEAFETLKKAGKVRYLGVSAHTDPAGVIQGALDAKVYSVAMIAYNIVNHSYVDKTLAKIKDADFGVIGMKVARPVHHGRKNYPRDDPRRVALIDGAVPGPLKVPHKAYLWALRNPLISAVNSEMINQRMVDENLPLAGTKV